jgi:hypothetical protein
MRFLSQSSPFWRPHIIGVVRYDVNYTAVLGT